MNPLALLLFTLVAVAATPTNETDAAALLHQNALDAQILNGEFQSINATDPCDSGQTACIQGAPAVCQFGAWLPKQCDEAQQCFALPKPTTRGTFIACLSDSEATSFFDQAGVTGGPVNITANSTIPLPTAVVSAPPSVTSSHHPKDGSSASGTDVHASTVTVTVTTGATTVIPTDSTVITTVSPDQAMSIIHSLLANGATILSAPSASAQPTKTPASDDGDNEMTSSASPTHLCTMTSSVALSSLAAQSTAGGGFEHKRSLHLRRASRH
ncbi:hypothetical protein BC835DRAFT_1397552 [Cytidiella melzeri]|nr:hypothetical protein BC835DRAFT_1397552 [Cytidiella melzeri]